MPVQLRNQRLIQSWRLLRLSLEPGNTQVVLPLSTFSTDFQSPEQRNPSTCDDLYAGDSTRSWSSVANSPLQVGRTFAVEGVKKCPRCEITKSRSDFLPHGRARDGLARICKVCNSEVKGLPPVSSPTVSEKECSGCKQVKPASEFSRRSSSPCGLQGYCKICARAAVASNIKLYLRRNETRGQPMVSLKECSTCRKIKPASEFSKDRWSYTGLMGYCKACKKEALVFRYDAFKDRELDQEWHVCRKCGEEKPVSDFYRDARLQRGTMSDCKACHIAKVLEIHRARKKDLVDKML